MDSTRFSLEMFIVAMVAIVAGQYWLHQRAYRLCPPAPDIKRRWNNCWGCGYRCVAGYAAVPAAAGMGAAVLTALSEWGGPRTVGRQQW